MWLKSKDNMSGSGGGAGAGGGGGSNNSKEEELEKEIEEQYPIIFDIGSLAEDYRDSQLPADPDYGVDDGGESGNIEPPAEISLLSSVARPASSQFLPNNGGGAEGALAGEASA